MSTYKLPSGKFTKSQTTYLREWRKITIALKKRFDLTCVGFDPGLLVSYKGGKSFDLPVDFAMALAARP